MGCGSSRGAPGNKGNDAANSAVTAEEAKNVPTDTVLDEKKVENNAPVEVDRVKYCFTAHYNWDWVVSEVIDGLAETENHVEVVKLKRCQDLPSQSHIEKKKPAYALFRVERVSALKLEACWAGDGFAFLDFKDQLYHHLSLVDAAYLMPNTRLLPYDASIDLLLQQAQLSHTSTYILKAACGSAGFGIYFIKSIQDVYTIIQRHKARAENYDNFLHNLKQSNNGSVPSWSLQEYKRSVRVNDKRTQLRVYAVLLNSNTASSNGDDVTCYQYSTIECRIPSWDTDLDQEIYSSSNGDAVTTESIDVSMMVAAETVDEVESACCRDTTARPYNKDRNKSETNRYLLEELPELVGYTADVRSTCSQCLQKLQPYLTRHMLQSTDNKGINNKGSIASVVGVDLIIDSDSSKCFILEFNYNPAMPSSTKVMSDLYRNHLHRFVRDTISLGLSQGSSSDLFERVF